MSTSTFSRADNARRAAHKAIADGTAPSRSFTIERSDLAGAIDGRFVIVWRDLGCLPSTDHAAASTLSPVETAAGNPATSADKRAKKPRKSVAKGALRPRAANAELDTAAAAGIMPDKPIVTSEANIRGQKRFDYLAARAAIGDWRAVKAYAINSNNTQAKQLKRYQARLLAYCEATTRATMTGLIRKRRERAVTAPSFGTFGPTGATTALVLFSSRADIGLDK